jgi:hypothetical protein
VKITNLIKIFVFHFLVDKQQFFLKNIAYLSVYRIFPAPGNIVPDATHITSGTSGSFDLGFTGFSAGLPARIRCFREHYPYFRIEMSKK